MLSFHGQEPFLTPAKLSSIGYGNEARFGYGYGNVSVTA